MIDELWEKYATLLGNYDCNGNEVCRINKADFIQALTEYGEHIKAQAVKVCENEWANTQYPRGANWCAAAIKRMEIK